MSQPPAPKYRVELPLQRINHKFLLKDISYSQHFSHVYLARLQQLQPRLMEVIRARTAAAAASGKKAPIIGRVLDVSSTSLDEALRRKSFAQGGKPGAAGLPITSNRSGATTAAGNETRVIIGTLYKNMPLFRGFLKDYQAELVRLEAGDDDDDEEGGGGDGGEVADDAGLADEEAMLDTADDDVVNQLGEDGAAVAVAGRICTDKDTLVLEDDSGRIELGGDINPAEFVTGVIVGVAGSVNERGVFMVSEVYTAEAAPPTKLVFANPSSSSSAPVYLALVSGLSITGIGSAPPSLEMLLDFMAGELGDDKMVEMASRIGRVVIGGGLVAETEEARLCQKVKLEPHDHARLHDVATGKVATASASTAAAMKHVDRFVAMLAKTVPVEVMPGPGDPTNCFLPQQPIHPIMLVTTQRVNGARLVTNPFSFSTSAGANNTNNSTSTAETAERTAAQFTITSGQNITDVVRQTKLSELDAMSRCLQWGHLCPTAPNSLPCFPFKEQDPFAVAQAPHCMVACGQQSFATRRSSKEQGGDGVRYVSVPSFANTGEVVLVDVNSPDLATMSIKLSLADE